MSVSTWAYRELVIMKAIREAEENGGDVNTAARNAVPSLKPRLYNITINALIDAGYIDGTAERAHSGELIRVSITKLDVAGLVAIGQWPAPGDAHDAVLHQIDNWLAGDRGDRALRSSMQQLRDALAAVDKGTANDLLADVLRAVV